MRTFRRESMHQAPMSIGICMTNLYCIFLKEMGEITRDGDLPRSHGETPLGLLLGREHESKECLTCQRIDNTPTCIARLEYAWRSRALGLPDGLRERTARVLSQH